MLRLLPESTEDQGGIAVLCGRAGQDVSSSWAAGAKPPSVFRTWNRSNFRVLILLWFTLGKNKTKQNRTEVPSCFYNLFLCFTHHGPVFVPMLVTVPKSSSLQTGFLYFWGYRRTVQGVHRLRKL